MEKPPFWWYLSVTNTDFPWQTVSLPEGRCFFWGHPLPWTCLLSLRYANHGFWVGMSTVLQGSFGQLVEGCRVNLLVADEISSEKNERFFFTWKSPRFLKKVIKTSEQSHLAWLLGLQKPFVSWFRFCRSPEWWPEIQGIVGCTPGPKYQWIFQVPVKGGR